MTLLALGAALLAATALACTPQLRAVGLPELGRTPRLSGVAAGVLCVAAGLILLGSADYDSPAGAVRTTIVAELSPGEISEEIRVFLDGRDVGVVRADARSPKAHLPVTVTRTGRHDYRLRSTVKLRGKPVEVARRSSQVVVGDGSRLGIYYGPDGAVYLMDMG
jgi:hypothetical protein